MALVAFDGTPLVIVGAPLREGQPYLGTAAGVATLLDATAEACIMLAQIANPDGGSHTIDTTGSSSLGWLSGALTFANVGTLVKVGLAALDMAAGPPGRAVNVANVITMDVSKSLAGGGGGITASLWQEHVPDTGTKTVANGDFVAFCVQMVTAAGADAVNAQGTAAPSAGAPNYPVTTNYTGGTYSAANVKLPNFVITYSDGTQGYPLGGSVYLTGTTTTTWNSGSATKEYGNYLLMPVPAKIYGIMGNCSVAGNTDFVLYSDPLGTPVAEKTISVDLNIVGGGAVNRWLSLMFAAPYSSTASQPLAAIMKPTSVTNVSSVYKTFNIAAHQDSETLGQNCYAVSRATGAFAAVNSNKDRYAIGLLVGAFEAGGGGAGGGAVFGGRGGVIQ